MTTTTVPGAQLPAPLAVDAATAERLLGPCAICRRPIIRYQRFARLVPDGRRVHVTCVARGTGASARRAA